MLQKFIKKIKAKPEPVRKSITFGASLAITGVVGFFWFISFLNYSSEVLLAKPKTESPTSFLNKMGSLIGESYANVRTKIDDTNSFVDVEIVATTTIDANDAKPANISASEKTPTGVSLQDILTTKKKDNQENNATTSSEVLVQ